MKKVIVYGWQDSMMLSLWLMISVFLTACQQLPANNHLLKSQQITQSIQQSTTDIKKSNLTAKVTQNVAKNISGYYPIISGFDALASRSILTNLAEHSIDVQYYIWHNDEASQLLLKDLYQSANRGVKVRLLLDDLNTNPKLDQQLLAFAQHPNIAVRLMNPKKQRKLMPMNFVTSFPRFHRRMHNKSMTFDKQLSIIGGRNIGDMYLRDDKDEVFSDLDVLLIGKVVQDIDESFEGYWNSRLSYDIDALIKPATSDENLKTEQYFIQTLDKIYPTNIDSTLKNTASLYQNTSFTSHFDKKKLTGKVPFRWVKIEFKADDVNKLLKKDDKNYNLVNQLRKTFGKPKRQFTMISSYFVPTRQGVKDLVKLANQGVKIKILTNSFDATDVSAVHAGYSETRRDLLKAGIEIYELKSTANPILKQNKTKNKQKKERSFQLKSSTSLHTKAFAVDNEKAFIGSYNIDPRSANINTELGVVIYDSKLVEQMHAMIGKNLLTDAYQVVLTPADTLAWQTIQGNPPKLHVSQNEPNMSIINLVWVQLFSFLPIDWLL